MDAHELRQPHVYTLDIRIHSKSVEINKEINTLAWGVRVLGEHGIDTETTIIEAATGCPNAFRYDHRSKGAGTRLDPHIDVINDIDRHDRQCYRDLDEIFPCCPHIGILPRKGWGVAWIKLPRHRKFKHSDAKFTLGNQGVLLEENFFSVTITVLILQL